MNANSQTRAPAGQGSPSPASGLSIGQYLIRRLQDYGLGHIFGVPGDYVLTFYGMLEQSPIEMVGLFLWFFAARQRKGPRDLLGQSNRDAR